LILAGESAEVDSLAKRATLIQAGAGRRDVVVTQELQNPSVSVQLPDENSLPGALVNYELWVSTARADKATPGYRTPIDQYRRVSAPSGSKPKILDVFA
jgi:hypothetical protein